MKDIILSEDIQNELRFILVEKGFLPKVRGVTKTITSLAGDTHPVILFSLKFLSKLGIYIKYKNLQVYTSKGKTIYAYLTKSVPTLYFMFILENATLTFKAHSVDHDVLVYEKEYDLSGVSKRDISKSISTSLDKARRIGARPSSKNISHDIDDIDLDDLDSLFA